MRKLIGFVSDINNPMPFWSPWLVRVPTCVISGIQCSWCSTNLDSNYFLGPKYLGAIVCIAVVVLAGFSYMATGEAFIVRDGNHIVNGLAPAYLSVDLRSIKHLPSRQRLRSWSSDMLAVPTSKLSTVGDRAFPIAAAQVWHTLSLDVRSSSSLSIFKRRLKTELFSHSFPD